MKKIIFFTGFFLFVFTGCSEKTVYPQTTGSIQTEKPQNIKVYFDKNRLLSKVDSKANKVFNKITKEEKIINDKEKNIIINSIYKNEEY